MHRSLIAMALMLLPPLAGAQVYKWTDAHGTVHYSQTAPDKGVSFQQIKTTGDATHAQDDDAMEPVAESATPEAAPATQPAPAASQAIADTPDNRRMLCDSLQSNLAVLKGSTPVVVNQDGKSTALDDSQRQQKIADTEAQYAQYCRAG